jgi:type I restriction enzyme R subunit
VTTNQTLAVIDWAHKDDVQREMRREIKRHLRAAGLADDRMEEMTARLMDLARARLAR